MRSQFLPFSFDTQIPLLVSYKSLSKRPEKEMVYQSLCAWWRSWMRSRLSRAVEFKLLYRIEVDCAEYGALLANGLANAVL